MSVTHVQFHNGRGDIQNRLASTCSLHSLLRFASTRESSMERYCVELCGGSTCWWGLTMVCYCWTDQGMAKVLYVFVVVRNYLLPPPPSLPPSVLSLSLLLVFPLISRRRFSQMEVLEGLNVLVCINGRKNKLRVYYLSWLRNKIVKGDDVSACFFLCCSCYHGDVFLSPAAGQPQISAWLHSCGRAGPVCPLQSW